MSAARRHAGAVVAAGVLGAAPALAAGIETPSSWLGLPMWVWGWLNLFVFWGLLAKFGLRPLRDYLARRRAAIAEGLEQAATQRRDAEAMRDELGTKIAALKTEMDEFLARNEEEGAREAERIREQAREDAAKLEQQTESQIENRVAQAKSELAAEATRLASELARETIEQRLTPEDRVRLFQENLARLGGGEARS